MILMIPVNAALATWSRKLQVKQMAFKDSRIKIVNELLNGIKVCALVGLYFRGGRRYSLSKCPPPP